MHRHDEDLIMALADGALSGEAADEARLEIEGCAECLADLEAQRTAVDWLRTVKPVAMSELEIARLSRNLDVELGHDRRAAVEPTPLPSRWSRVPWTPLVAVAAVLVAVVLVAPSLNLLGGGDDADTVAAEFATDTTAASRLQELLNDARVRSTDGGGAEAPPAAAPDEVATESAEAAEPAAETTMASDVAADDGAGFSVADEQLDEILARVEDAGSDMDLLTETLEDEGLFNFREYATEPSCLVESAELFPEAVQREAIGFIELDEHGDTLVIVHFDENDDVLGVVAHDLITCEPVSIVTASP